MNDQKINSNKQRDAGRSYAAVLSLSGMLIVQVIFYGYFVNASVGHVVGRIDTEERTGELVSDVSRLESTYFALQSSVTSETAKTLNYTSKSTMHYINAQGAAVNVLTRSN